VAYVVHRVCEEFGVLPAVAARAIESDTGLIGEVLDVRAFVRAWDLQASYEAQEPRSDRAPAIPRPLRDRLTTARVARLMALKGGGVI
jgi:hypothetical protein